MNFIKELWSHKKEDNGRKCITVFFINIFLIMVHLFLMAVYMHIHHNFMVCINTVSILYYVLCYKKCVTKIDLYIGFSFFEIWVHMICATLSFGWMPCFQNWSYAILTASFLPAFNSDNYVRDNKKALFFALIVILTYFGLGVLSNCIDLNITYPLSNIMKKILFIFNNLISFFTIIMFAYFYTSNKTRKESELTRKADYDELTNLYNRYSINQLGDKIIEDAKIANKPYNVAILDIDFFKDVNDKYGHSSGDLVLIELAKILKNHCRNTAISGRWGGEEFVIISSHEVKYRDFVDLLKRLKSKIIKTKFLIENNKKISLTVSIGSSSVKEYESLDKAISIADDNLYKAKNNGRNKLVS